MLKCEPHHHRSLLQLYYIRDDFFSGQCSADAELQQRIPQRAKTEWKGYSKQASRTQPSWYRHTYGECFMQQKYNLCKIEHIICTYSVYTLDSLIYLHQFMQLRVRFSNLSLRQPVSHKQYLKPMSRYRCLWISLHADPTMCLYRYFHSFFHRKYFKCS